MLEQILIAWFLVGLCSRERLNLDRFYAGLAWRDDYSEGKLIRMNAESVLVTRPIGL